MFEDQNFYKDVIDNLYDGVYITNRERVILYWNKGAERITGYAGDRVVGTACHDNLLNHVTAEGVQLCKELCPLAACMKDGQLRDDDVFLHHADGHRVPVMVRVAPLRDAKGEIVGAVETFSSDMRGTAVRRELRELRRTAKTDKLTQISNRSYLEGRLHGVIAELEHQRGAAGLLLMDIDHFKQCNDTYGHDVGDKVLRMVAATLRHNVREGDTVGRWGGEEFLAILYDVATVEELKGIAGKLRALVASSRLDLEAVSLTVTISIGATMFLPADTAETVVRRADELMYESKRAGRNRVSVG